MQELSKEILIKASKGDLEAFEAIYKETAGFVYNVGFRIINNKHDAEEVTQDVFISIYHNLKHFRFQSSFKTWVYRITVNCAINHCRKLSREKERRREYRDNLIRLGEDIDELKMEHAEGCFEETVNSFLKVLNPEQKACIVLRSIEGLSYRQIADTLKVNINTVRTRLKRARMKLLSLGRKEGE